MAKTKTAETQESVKPRYIVTSALPYINGVKHLGNLIGSLLPADVYARFLRQRGEDVIAICGTDEHGTPAELSALDEGLPVAEYCEKYWKVQADIYDRFGLSFDYFGRTSSPENAEQTQHLFHCLERNGYIEEQEIEQVYSVDEARYLPDRYIIGTCPNCSYDRARGDQCENCGKLLDPIDLIKPKSVRKPDAKLEFRKVKHLYLNLPKAQPAVEAWLKDKDHWPPTSINLARGLLKEGLISRCITRDLKWGIAVPRAGYEDKVFYVWFDAPIGYIGITREWADKVKGEPDAWRPYWKDPSTRLVQFMAKDNIPFHTLTWPATMLGADDGFVTAWFIKGFQWLNYEDGKFSTSQNRGVFTDTALELYPPDYWRYYLLSIAPEKADTNFTWEGFQSAVNADLADVLGNLVNRTTKFIEKYFDAKVPPIGPAGTGDAEAKLFKAIEEHEREFNDALRALEFGRAARALRAAWVAGNLYFDDTKPWNLRKTDLAACGTVMNVAAHLLRKYAVWAAPFIPHIAAAIVDALAISDDVDLTTTDPASLSFEGLTGHEVAREQPPIVKKIEPEEVDDLRARFAGKLGT